MIVCNGLVYGFNLQLALAPLGRLTADEIGGVHSCSVLSHCETLGCEFPLIFSPPIVWTTAKAMRDGVAHKYCKST
jgi:hypothetical protein